MYRLVAKFGHALYRRAFLLGELARARRLGMAFPQSLWWRAFRRPSSVEDLANFLRFISPDDHILLVDVGANIGDWAADFRYVFPNTKIVGFEPVGSTFRRLQEKFSGDDTVRLFNCALSDREQKLGMHIGDQHVLSSFHEYDTETSAYYQHRAGRREEVECRTLDSLSIDKGDRMLLLKVDVQGHEEEVFNGAGDFLSKVDICIVEASLANEYKDKKPSFPAVTRRLEEAGLYPIIFQDFGRAISPYAFERDVIYVKRSLLNNIFGY